MSKTKKQVKDFFKKSIILFVALTTFLGMTGPFLFAPKIAVASPPSAGHMSINMIDGEESSSTTLEFFAYVMDDLSTSTTTPPLQVSAHYKTANQGWSTSTNCTSVETGASLFRCILTDKVAQGSNLRTFQYYIKAGDGTATSCISYAVNNDCSAAEADPFQATVYNTPSWTNVISGLYSTTTPTDIWPGVKDGRDFQLAMAIPATPTSTIYVASTTENVVALGAMNTWILLGSGGGQPKKFKITATTTDIFYGEGYMRLTLSGLTEYGYTLPTSLSKFIAGATVFIPGIGINTTSSDVQATSTFGNFVLRNVPDGCWDVMGFKRGYKMADKKGICISGTTTSTIDMWLPYGSWGGGGDTEGAFVIWTAPMDGMMGAPTEIELSKMPILINFSENLATSTVTTTNVLLKKVDQSTGTATAVSGYQLQYEYQNKTTSSFGPDAKIIVYSSIALATSSQYIVIVTSDVTDIQGNPVSGNRGAGGHDIFFGTSGSFFGPGGPPPDMFGMGGGFMPPFVMNVLPGFGDMNIARNTKIAIEFSESMDSTLLSGNIQLWKLDSNYNEVSQVSITPALARNNNAIVIVTPGANLESGTRYKIKILGGLKSSSSGMTMGPPGSTETMFMSEFETGSVIDGSAPAIWGTSLDRYESGGNYTGVPVSGIFKVSISEPIDPETLSVSTIYLRQKGSTSNITGIAEYDLMEGKALLMPSTALNATTTYILTLTYGIKDFTSAANALATTTYEFTTRWTDADSPRIEVASADDYQISVTFSEPMNAAKITDTSQWSSGRTKGNTSVLNPRNYIVNHKSTAPGDPGVNYVNPSIAWTSLSTAANVSITYDAIFKTVNIEGLMLEGGGFGITVASTTDISGNELMSSGASPPVYGENMAGGPIMRSMDTFGMMGPGGGGMFGGGAGGGEMFGMFEDFGGKNPGMMGMMPVGVWPMNMVAGMISLYMADLPISQAIPANGKIVLGPFKGDDGFDISGATDADPNKIFVHQDINGPGPGQPQISSISVSGEYITVTLGSVGTGAPDFIHFEIDGIRNPSFSKGGYSIGVETQKSTGVQIEAFTGDKSPMRFFMMPAREAGYVIVGSVTSTVAVAPNTNGLAGVKIFGGSPMTGPLFTTTVNDAFGSSTDGEFKLEGLSEGMVMLETEPYIEINDNQYIAQMPGPIFLDTAHTYNSIAEAVAQGTPDCTADLTAGEKCYYYKKFTLIPVSASAVAPLVVKIAGFGASPSVTTTLDIFAGGPQGFAVKTVTIGEYTSGLTDPWNKDESVKLYLPSEGFYMVGIGPAMPKGPMGAGVPPPPTIWMPPEPKQINVASSTNGWVWDIEGASTSTVTFTIHSANLTLSGYVYDKDGALFASSTETEVFAFSQAGMFGNHTHLKTDGSFSIKVKAGFYKVGTFLPGMPPSGETGIEIKSNGDVYIEGIKSSDNKVRIYLAKPDYTLSGYVYSDVNGIYTATGVSVYAYRTDGPGHVETITDSMGRYTLYVTSGAWTLGAYLPDYGNLPEKTFTVAPSKTGIKLKPSADVQYITIRERIYEDKDGSGDYDASKDAVVNRASVTITGTNYTSKTITDDQGVYEFKVPATTTYEIVARHPDLGKIPPVSKTVTSTDYIYDGVYPSFLDLPVPTATTVDIYFFDHQGNATTVDKALIQMDKMGSKGISNEVVVNSASSTSLKVPCGADYDYLIDVDIPGIPKNLLSIVPFDYATSSIATTTVAGVRFATTTVDGSAGTSGDGHEKIKIILPPFFTISGTIEDGSGNDVPGAVVHIELPGTDVELDVRASTTAGYYEAKIYGTTTASYLIQADQAGHIDSSDVVNVTSTSVSHDLVVEAAAHTISGTIIVDGSAFDPSVGQPMVWAERFGGGSVSTRAKPDGTYNLNVPNGKWRVSAIFEGKTDATLFRIADISGGDVNSIDLNITASKTGIVAKQESVPNLSSVGGTVKNSDADFKIEFPRYAFKDSDDRVVKQKEISNAPAFTPTANLIANTADSVHIYKSNSKGNSSDMGLQQEVAIDKAFTPTELASSGMDTIQEIENCKMASFGEGASQNWETMPTTIAYLDENDYPVIPNETLSNVEKVVFNGTTKHFSIVGVTDSSPKGKAPAAPTNFRVESGGWDGVNLFWDASASSDIHGYSIYRSSSGSGSTYNRIASVGINTTTYLDNTISAGISYHYWVSAERGLPSSEVSGSGSRGTAPVSGGGGISGGFAYVAPEFEEEVAVVEEEAPDEEIKTIEEKFTEIKIPVFEKLVSEMTISELKTKIIDIAAVVEQLKVLLAEITEVEPMEPVEIIGIPTEHEFATTLMSGQVSDDIKYLQIFLNSNSETQLAKSGVGSSGYETNYFGPLTKVAVIKFQEKYSEDVLSPWELIKGTGLVGSTTRAKINELLGR